MYLAVVFGVEAELDGGSRGMAPSLRGHEACIPCACRGARCTLGCGSVSSTSVYRAKDERLLRLV